jgi:ADP-heptose:LPS heptosyltransferase
MQSLKLRSIERICVFAWGLIGDLFIRIPVIEALKQRYPNARMTVVVDPRGEEVLAQHPDVDEVLVFSRAKKPILTYLLGLFRNISYMRRQHYDLTVDLYGSGSSPHITRWVSARWRLGFDHTPILRKVNNILAPHPSFIATSWHLALGKILKPLGIDRVRQGTTFICSAQAHHYADGLLQHVKGPLVAINPGAGAKNKCWPVERFVALAQRLVAQDFKILLFTNPGQEHLADEFESLYGNEASLIRVPVVYLDKEGALMQHCDFVVTGDTSLLHLTMGVKVPFLGIFLVTHPACVLPEDVLHEVCFQEGRASDKVQDTVSPSDLPVDYVYSQALKLIDRLNAKTSSDRMVTSQS